MNLEKRLQAAVQSFWEERDRQSRKQKEAGKADAGIRGAVTGGQHLAAVEALIVEVLLDAGLASADIRMKSRLELPGYYRAEKKWDLLVVSRGQLVAAIELKSQAGESIGNNFNNRSEEAIGTATDLWVAFREGRFQGGRPPFLGYFFLLEDFPKVKRPVRNKEPHFSVDPVFQNASYTDRYEILSRRLILERLYSSVCLTLATRPTAKTPATTILHPSPDVSFRQFVATLQGHVYAFLKS